MLDTDVDELERLRRADRDLAACLALPALWAGRNPPYIVRTLLDTLTSMLELDLAYAVIRSSGGEVLMEEWRPRTSAPPFSIDQTAGRWTGDVAADPPVLHVSGLGDVRLAEARISSQGGSGIVLAASRRSDFPAERDTGLLRAAANQAAIALNNAELVAREHFDPGPRASGSIWWR